MDFLQWVFEARIPAGGGSLLLLTVLLASLVTGVRLPDPDEALR